MTHGSLFSGIGGFDLASEWMGWENVFHCEREPFAQEVLKYHFPNSKLYDDVTTFDATTYAGRIDILTGGFPCQPFSSAGKRLGTEDERHLWPEMLRIIREVAPRYVVGENVRGLLNWSGGLVFEEVCANLEVEGYEVTPYILPACGKNAPHRRDRIWFIARRIITDSTSKSKRSLQASVRRKHAQEVGVQNSEGLNDSSKSRTSTNTTEKRLHTCETVGKLVGKRLGRVHKSGKHWEDFPTEPPICSGNDGFSKGLDGITFPKWRTESIKAYGNAIVPAVAHEIFKAIQKMEDQYEEEELEEELNVITQAH
tara:strand:- start:52 stop:987 length:936 start_codon:yes stop_codon:yes gene_type:complete